MGLGLGKEFNCFTTSKQTTPYPKKKMKSFTFAFALFAFFKATEAGNHSEPGNQVLFTVIGKTTRESGYAHLVIPIPMPDLKKTLFKI